MLVLPLLGGCSTVGYYAQAVGGHFDILSRTRPVAELVQDPAQPEELRRKLQLTQRVRRFAAEELGLPESDSYTRYADLERPYVVWNVIATPADSITPRRWCFPLVGCISYRGYFDAEAAERYAAELAAQGFDVQIAGATAYSTLGWLDDPLLNTFMIRDEVDLVELIAHETAHQQLYVAGDSSFNEAFAVAVSEEAVRRWLAQHGTDREAEEYEKRRSRRREFQELLLATRERLDALYGSGAPAETMAQDKREAFAALKQQYQELRERWGGYGGYDTWMSQELNNAHLALVATYHRLVPAFRRLLTQQGGDLRRFYAAASEIGDLEMAVRGARMEALLEDAWEVARAD